MDLKKLKEEYSIIEKKYNLPSFSNMNEDFDIEKIIEKDTELLIREIRRAMLEKNTAYLRFIDMTINPSNSPMFLMILLKNIESTEKKFLNELYMQLGKYEIISLKLDNIYDEKAEAEFINSFYARWQEIKKEFSLFISSFEESMNKKTEKKEKGYLG